MSGTKEDGGGKVAEVSESRFITSVKAEGAALGIGQIRVRVLATRGKWVDLEILAPKDIKIKKLPRNSEE